MKESLIREIYFGTYDPVQGRHAAAKERNGAFDEILEMQRALMKRVPEEFRMDFEKFSDACLSLLSEQSAEDFEAGYRLGVRLMIAALADDAKNI